MKARSTIAAGLLVAGAAPAAVGHPLPERVAEMAARTAARAAESERRTHFNVTVNAEGHPLAKAFLLQTEDQPELQLEATLLALPANPRDPAEPRRRRAAFQAQLLNRDAVFDPAAPHLVLELDAGTPLAVNNLSPFLEPAVAVAEGEVEGLDALLAAEDYGLSGAAVRTLETLKETVRGRFTHAGEPCDSAASLVTRFPGELTIVLEPRCVGVPAGELGALVLELSEVEVDEVGNPILGVLEKSADETSLAPSVAGELLLVPRTRSGELYSEAASGFLRYGDDESGEKRVDFVALNAGSGAAGSGPCEPDATTLCIDDEPGDRRFEVTMSWHTALNGGQGGDAEATPLASLALGQGGLFSFTPANPEMLVKVLDGCTVNGHFWVFGAPTTTLGFELGVVDTVARDAGEPASVYLLTVTNEDGETAASFANTEAFDTCEIGGEE